MAASPVPRPEPTTRPSPLRNRGFLRLWVGSVTSSAGSSIGSIVLIWLVYSVTRSALAISLLGILQFVPTLMFGLLAGALIDRLDRRRVMIVCDVARSVCFAALAVVVLVEGVSTVVLFAVVFVVATFSTVFRPATNAVVPRLLASEQLADGNGLLQGGTTVASFIGSPLGGFLLVAVGAVVGLAVNAVTFAVSGAMIVLMVVPARSGVAAERKGARRSLLRDVGEGLRYLRSQRPLLTITLTSMAANFFLSIWGGFIVIYAASYLHAGATGFAFLVAANTGGFAVGAVLPGRFGVDRRPGRTLLWTWGPVGFVILGIAATTSLAVAILLSVIAGTLLAMGNTTWLTGVQRAVPDDILGRYFATDEAGSFAMIPAGIAVGGVLVLTFGIAWAYAVAGVGTLVVNVPLFLSPAVRAWGAPPPSDPERPRSLV